MIWEAHFQVFMATVVQMMIIFTHFHVEVKCPDVSKECSASSFRVTELLQVDKLVH